MGSTITKSAISQSNEVRSGRRTCAGFVGDGPSHSNTLIAQERPSPSSASCSTSFPSGGWKPTLPEHWPLPEKQRRRRLHADQRAARKARSPRCEVAHSRTPRRTPGVNRPAIGRRALSTSAPPSIHSRMAAGSQTSRRQRPPLESQVMPRPPWTSLICVRTSEHATIPKRWDSQGHSRRGSIWLHHYQQRPRPLLLHATQQLEASAGLWCSRHIPHR